MASLSVPKSASLEKRRSSSSSKYVFDASATAPAPPKPLPNDTEPSSNNKPSGRPLGRKRSSLSALEQAPQPATTTATAETRRRSTSAITAGMGKPLAKRLTKNYKNLVKDYNIMKKYAKQADGSYQTTTLCAFCEVVRPRLVFFPCQHMCVCDHCLSLNDITSEPTSPSSWTACPVCMADIRLMLPVTGDEEEIYWRWALQVPPGLPVHFKSDFRAVGRKLRGSSSSVQPGEENLEQVAESSSEDKQPPIQPPPPSVQPPVAARPRLSSQSIRRFSLPLRRTSVARVPQTPENEGRCSIL